MIVLLPSPPDLTSKDILTFQKILKQSLNQFLKFSEMHIFFPNVKPSFFKNKIIFFEQDRIHIALEYKQKFLGMLVLKKYSPHKIRGLKTALPHLIHLILEKLALYKMSFLDKELNIYNYNYLKMFSQKIISAITSLDVFNPTSLNDNFYSSFDLILLKLVKPDKISPSLYTYIFNQLISLLKQKCSPWSIFTYSINTLAITLTNLSSKKSKLFLKNLWESVNTFNFSHPISKQPLSTQFALAMTSFPHHLKIKDLKENAKYLFFDLQQKTLLALQKSEIFNEPFTYPKVLQCGGKITALLPLNRVKIDIGSTSGVTKGKRFLILSNSQLDSKIKGEIIIDKTYNRSSEGKLILPNAPYLTPSIHDRLKLSSQPDLEISNPTIWPEHELLKKAQELYNQKKQIGLVLIKHSEQSLNLDLEEKIKSILRPSYIQEISFSTFGLILTTLPEKIKKQCLKLEKHFWEQSKKHLYIGIAYLPLAQFKLTDLYLNAQKALEHAHYFSKRPFLALFDSTTLTISADKLFKLKNFYEAISEYQNALLLDPKNVLALNSLGVIYASLGELHTAKEMFIKTLNIDPKNEPALYNLGRTLDKLGEHQQAASCYLKCVTPHYKGYAYLWLGLNLEKQHNWSKAKQYYLKAQNLLPTNSQPDTFLANLYFQQNKNSKAIEYLHSALLKNSNDAWALNLLAKVYLQENKNLKIAESLARHSVSLKPEIPDFWETLKKIQQLNKTLVN